MKRERVFAVLLFLVGLILTVLIVTDWFPVIRGPIWQAGEWYWPYLLRPTNRLWLPTLSFALTLLVIAWWLRTDNRRGYWTILGLVFLMICSVLLQISFVYMDRGGVLNELVDRTLAVQTSGYFRTAVDFEDLNQVLREYPDSMNEFESEHARTHPPGLVMGNWLLLRIFERLPVPAELLSNVVRPLRCTDLWLLDASDETAAALAFAAVLPILLAALTIPLSFLIAGILFSVREARLSAALVATLPALLLFAPLADQLFAFFSLSTLLLLVYGLRRRSSLLLFLAGMSLSLASFLSLGNLVILVVIIGLIAVEAWFPVEGRFELRPWIKHASAFLFGLVSVWLGYWLIWKVPPWDIGLTAVKQHYELVTSHRNYGTWLGFNVVDLFIYSGAATFVGFIGYAVYALREGFRQRINRKTVFGLSIAVLVFGLIISGTARGEVGRIWLFLLPLLAIPAAAFYGMRLSGSFTKVLAVAVQLLLAAAIGAAWQPVDAVIVQPSRPPLEQPGNDIVAVNELFSESIALIGYSLDTHQVRPGKSLALSLIWESGGPASRPYTVFAHLLDSDANIVTQKDSWSVRGQWPPTCWQEGDIVVDPITIPIPTDAQPGEHQLLIGLYDGANGQRLRTISGRDFLSLGNITITTEE